MREIISTLADVDGAVSLIITFLSIFGLVKSGKKSKDNNSEESRKNIYFAVKVICVIAAIVFFIIFISSLFRTFNSEGGWIKNLTNGINQESQLNSTTYKPSASSYLSYKGRHYPPENLNDGSAETAWIAGKNGLDIGEWVVLDFERDVTLSGISLINGFAKADNQYRSYYNESRVKKISIESSGGFYIEADLQDDTYTFQDILFENSITVSYLKITILDIYQGDPDNFTAISEISVF